jgi:hypothetical protein
MAADASPVEWRDLPDAERLQWAAAFAPYIHVDRQRRVVVASGPCSRCNHAFTTTLTESTIFLDRADMRGPLALDADWNELIRFIVACACLSEHPGRPQEVRYGCGASARFIDEP